jgi:hypothetical protein
MKRWILCICILALAASAADAAPSRASSRIRAYKGLMEVEVAGGAEHAVLDSLAGEAARDGYTQVSRDDEKLRMRWERTATAEEVAPAGWTVEGTERRRLQFEVVGAKDGRPQDRRRDQPRFESERARREGEGRGQGAAVPRRAEGHARAREPRVFPAVKPE